MAPLRRRTTVRLPQYRLTHMPAVLAGMARASVNRLYVHVPVAASMPVYRKNTAIPSHTTGSCRVLLLDTVRTGVWADVSRAAVAAGHHVWVRPKHSAKTNCPRPTMP